MNRSSRTFGSETLAVAQGGGSSAPRTRLRLARPRPLALEPRFMFDGAAVGAVAQTVVNEGAHPLPELIPLTETRVIDAHRESGKKEVVFIDSAVADYSQLLTAVNPGVEVHLLSGGLEQLARWAETHRDYDVIHLLSPGAAGSLSLGGADDQPERTCRSPDSGRLGCAGSRTGPAW